MRTKKEEAKLAFELWATLARLESILWDKYDKEFMEMMDLEMTETTDNYADHEDGFPF